MAPTLADLLSNRSLALTCVTGHDSLHRPVSRVHVAEVSDPSPWLTRDVLLLTTGLLERTPEELDNFFAALAGREIAAVGFGVGLIVEAVPEEWVRAADQHGIPLLSIPLSTPYIAISEFVSTRLADRQLDQVRRMLEVQQRIAYSEATPAQQIEALRYLARELEAVVLWIAPDGALRTAGDGIALGARERQMVSTELSRHIASGRSTGSASIGGLFVHLKSTAGSPIAVARPRRYSPLEQGLIGSLATFIDLSRDTAALPGLAASLREQLLSEAITGRLTADARLFEVLFSGTEACTAVFLAPTPETRDARVREPAAGLLLKSYLAAELAEGIPAAAPLLSTVDDGFYLILPTVSANRAAPAVERFLTREASMLTGWSAGISETREPGILRELCASARRAQEATAFHREALVLSADQLGHLELMGDWFRSSGEAPVFSDWRLRITDLEPARAERLLGPLRAFLSVNGALERAAAALGLHRQTLNARLAEVERVLGVSLSDPTDRALLWLGFESGALNGTDAG